MAFLGMKKKISYSANSVCACACVPLMQTQSLISMFWVCRSTVRVKKMLTINTIIIIILAVLCGMWDFSSLARD